MKQSSLALIAGSLLILSSCGDSKKDGTANLNDKKAALAKLQSNKSKTDVDIKNLQDEIAKSDTISVGKVKLVGAGTVALEKFEHYIDLQGKIDAENISHISPNGMGGLVKALFIRQGQSVKKGQLLLKLDDKIQQQSVVTARQQMQGVKTQLNYAKNIYDRQKNLWDQGIGTEVQLLTAKTNVEGLENQLKSMSEQVQLAVVQANTSNIYSDVSGIADFVNIKVGETFTGMTNTGAPQIQIVNTSNLKIVATIPENYISSLKKGMPVIVTAADLDRSIHTTISLLSQAIDPSLRGFIAEAKIPYDPLLKPNQTAVMKIRDYAASNAVVIPVNVIQSDESGKYVFVTQKISDRKVVARKKSIVMGQVYGDKAEIKSGLNAGETLITEGYQSLYDGQQISTTL